MVAIVFEFSRVYFRVVLARLRASLGALATRFIGTKLKSHIISWQDFMIFYFISLCNNVDIYPIPSPFTCQRSLSMTLGSIFTNNF